MNHLPSRMGIATFRTAILLFGLGVLFPVKAEATCGDYLWHGARMDESSGLNAPSSSLQIRAGAPATVPPGTNLPRTTNLGQIGAGMAGSPGLPQMPCSGPFCSNNSVPPPMPSAPQPSVVSHNWGLLFRTLLVGPPPLRSWAERSRPARAALAPSRIFRPPR